MEKPGGPQGTPRHLKPEKPDSWLDLIKPRGEPQGGADSDQAQEKRGALPTFCVKIPLSPRPGTSLRTRPRPPPEADFGTGRTGAHSCNWRFSDSTSSESAVSLVTSASILRTACRTVVWSRPPNRRPISGKLRSVSVLARYIATWRGRTTLAVRREDKRSERLTLYCRATTR